MNHLYKAIRILTLAPILASISLLLLFQLRPDIFPNGVMDLGWSLFFLGVLPLTAYPLQPFFPPFKNQGREGQRHLAILMAVTGYLGGFIYTQIMHTPWNLLLIFLEYLISGALILLFNKVLKIKASGHACGVAGPLFYLCYFIGCKALWAIPVVFLVYWSSLRMKRHTWSELIWGTFIPLLSLTILLIAGAT